MLSISSGLSILAFAFLLLALIEGDLRTKQKPDLSKAAQYYLSKAAQYLPRPHPRVSESDSRNV
jgi:hypothetical protein